REVAAWKDLRHTNVLPFIGVFEQNSRIYMLSPWMEKGELIRFLRQNPKADRKKLLLQIAEGLRYLHTLDPVVVHGDLRGANILITDAGEACLADFGLSHRVINGAVEGNSTTWHAAGNPRWQAPELLK
ncbi:hypothetical protein BOTBODRAFT_73750, partial [Botryobasidium botryosum FD-172 SS1]